MKKKITLIVLTISMAIYNVTFVPTAKAWPVFDVITEIQSTFDVIFNGGSFYKDVSDTIMTFIDKQMKTLARMLALAATQAAVDELLGKGSGKSPFVTNWNQYLYLSPQQKTMTYLQGMFNQSTRGRASLANYEGIGQKHDQYLLRQAQASISPQPMTVNLREFTPNMDNIFDSKSFRSFNSWMACPNNPDCIALLAQTNFAKQIEKEVTVAEKSTVNGFVSQMKNGRIVTPAALVSRGFTELDKYGSDLIINGQEYGDIVLGSVVRIAGATSQKAYGNEALISEARDRNSTAQKINFDYTQLKDLQNSTVDRFNAQRTQGTGDPNSAGFVGPTQQ